MRSGRLRAITAAACAALLATVLPSVGGSPVAGAEVSPVARWTFDAGSGTVVSDAVGSANGTRLGGSSWLTSGAAVGAGAMAFDGLDGRVEIPSAASLEPSDLLLTAWVRGSAANPPTDGQVIVEKGAFGCDGPSYGLSVSPSGVRLSLRLEDGQQLSAELTAAAARTTLWDGGWHLVAARVDLVGNQTVNAYLSIDGSPMSRLFEVGIGVPMSAVALYDGETTADLAIGARANSACTGTSFRGDIDDVRVYSDPWVEPGSLLPPIPITISEVGPTTARLHELMDYVAHVTATPTWGAFYFQYLSDGVWETRAQIQGPDVPESGNIVAPGIAPPIDGDAQMRVIYVGPVQYVVTPVEFGMTVLKWATTTTVAQSPSPGTPFEPVTLTATVGSELYAAQGGPGGSVEFWNTTGLTPVLLGTVPLPQTPQSTTAQASLQLSTFDVGTHKIVAKYVGPDYFRSGSESAEYSLVIGKAPTDVSVFAVGGESFEANHSFQLEAFVYAANDQWQAGATMTFRRVGLSTPICVVAVSATNATRCTVPPQPLGAWQYTATYSGNTRNLASTGGPISIDIVPDAVHASGVGVSYSTFYPVTDGYRDSLQIKGTREEPIAVTARIYSPGGSLLRTLSASTGSGAYSLTWNGRNSSGAVLPEGKYKVVQTLKDGAGTTRTSTHYVNLSKKRLYTYTKTILKAGSAITAKGTSGTGSVTLNTSSGYALLKSGSNGWAGAGWEFTIPTAVIYKSIKFQVYAKRGLSAPPTEIGMQNFGACPYNASSDWNVGCFDHLRPVGNRTSTSAWYTSPGSVTANRAGTKVRGMISDPGGAVYVYKAQVVVTYQVLRY